MPDSNQIVVCVAGMHRSGTSMITRLLNLCGLDLGAANDMMPASPANPEGYWEHIWFNYYNNQLLEFFRGAWDMVPVYEEDWVNTPGIHWIKREAGAVIKRFESPVWGFKDPRSSITLPFWKSLLPHMRTLVCLRNPLDVAASLNKRGSSSIIFGLQLWWQYNSLLLLGTTPQERVVTHFDAYFKDGRAELNRLVAALGMQASEPAIEEAMKTSNESLRHSVTSMEKLTKSVPWNGLMETYCKLLTESGEVCQHSLGEDWAKVQELAARWTPKSCCLPTTVTGHELREQVAQARHELEKSTALYQQQLASAREQMAELRFQQQRFAEAVAQVSAQRDESLARLNEVMAENHAIKTSKTWRMLMKAGSIGMRTKLVKGGK